jgi:hypothetical protein
MAKTFILFGLAFALLLFSGVAHAVSTCSQNAYKQSCASCIGPDGKMNQECYKGKQSAGIGCVSASHPIASAAYAQGKCPGIDACASALSTCRAQMGSGNDSADCQEGSVGQCFYEADLCVDKAALDCGERPPDACKPPAGLIMLIVGAVFLFGFIRRQ